MPGVGTGEGAFLRLRVEVVQELRPELDEEQHLRRDAVGRAPGASVGGVDADLEMHEAEPRSNSLSPDPAVRFPRRLDAEYRGS